MVITPIAPMITPAPQDRLLLAGTRLTGAYPHLGTFYGWIQPLRRAADSMNVCVLIADLQSLDAPREQPLAEQASHLEQALKELLPPQIAIVRESAIRALPTLALLIAALFSGHHLRRVAPLRAAARTVNNALAGGAAPVPWSTLVYPATMAADLLAFGASDVLAKPEGRFQHIDVLNDVLARASRRYPWTTQTIQLYPKPSVNIPSADGSAPMKRHRPGYLPVPTTHDRAAAWTARLPTPPDPTAAGRAARCPVAHHVWTAIAGTHPPTSHTGRRASEHLIRCHTNAITCTNCLTMLADAISCDVGGHDASSRDTNDNLDRAAATPRRRRDNLDIITDANRTCLSLIAAATGHAPPPAPGRAEPHCRHRPGDHRAPS